MADKFGLKMFRFIFFVALSFQTLVFIVSGEDFENVCDCYKKCASNFTTNSNLDVVKTAACQRGCRFFTIAHVKSHIDFAQNSCVLSCRESYRDEIERIPCISGCFGSEKGICIFKEMKTPQFSFSITSETDILFSAAELDPDYVHTDPGLRNQIALSEELFEETKPKLPEIRFRDLPPKSGNPVRAHVHANLKCPKFYGLDSKLEFKNGKVIVGDLYLFAGVFIFVVLCFLVGHQMESKGMRKHSLLAKKMPKDRKEPGGEKDRLLKEVIKYDADYILDKSELYRCPDGPKFTRSITLIFHDDSKAPEEGILAEYDKDGNHYYIRDKITIDDPTKYDTVFDIDEKNFNSSASREHEVHEIV